MGILNPGEFLMVMKMDIHREVTGTMLFIGTKPPIEYRR
jgi:hypothetical protein